MQITLLKQWNFIFSQFWRLEFQDQCAVRVVSGEASFLGLWMAIVVQSLSHA